MKLYETTENKDIQTDIKSLMATARRPQDLSNWFRHNLRSIGMIPPENLEYAEVQLGLNSIEQLKRDDLDNPVAKAYVSVTISQNALYDPDLESIFMMDGFGKSEATSSFRIFLPFKDWPFLTSDAAIRYLQDRHQGYPAAVNFNEKAVPILHRFIPIHFPGLTWEALEGLYDNGLLPLRQDSSLDEEALRTILFETRQTLPTIDLPTLLTP